MKKVKLLLIAIIGICASCSTDDVIIKTQESVNETSRSVNETSRGGNTDPDLEYTEYISFTMTYDFKGISELEKSLIRDYYFSIFHELVSYAPTETNNREIWYATEEISNVRPSLGEATGTDGDLSSRSN